ncbi:NADH-quinone oxidoreductase subunit G [Mycolicibacterium komossense]|uniref:NADH-quinone oxidoreductase n=1 Tax=Mycolicibacterium komossense TaxID=1779 RepID=A0ABT3CN06_9MYCO|nr:NADH-quinone oxidoreductase subunit G [Mycolicibacterium komossense]MCV7230825.1 NADH-quinone oxidoreductase subunit G [Mycolicibacterium komossense]
MTRAENASRTDVELITVTIDEQSISVPQGTLVIRAAELIGVQIPRFCDHPLLEPVGACRQCLVEVEGQRKPMASCTVACTPDMVVRTQHTSAVADRAQQGVMELLLINHPLDCPVCDKGGECPLQNQAMTTGRVETRFDKVKRTYPKPINLSAQVLLDRERCVLCARCTRFSDQVAGDPSIELLERGALQQVGIADDQPFDSYFSGNTVQICPVGALTGTTYRFRARPFDLISSPSVCEHCASGCAQRTDHRRGKVLRRLAGDDPEVNEEWNCDKGRWAHTYPNQGDRLTTPLIRTADGTQRPVSWPEALSVAAAGLAAAVGRTGVLVGGRMTLEDAYAYSKFARLVLATNDIDFRSRAHSLEEEDFLSGVAVRPMEVSYADLEVAPIVLLAGLEPEEESPIVFLRLRKAARHGVPVVSIAPFATRGLTKMCGRLIPTAPGHEAGALDAMRTDGRLRLAGAVIAVGERLATAPGALTAAAALAQHTGARLVWVPRRAGDRGALEAGCLPNLLPGGRPVAHPRAREQVRAAWDLSVVPAQRGRSTTDILDAARHGTLGALVIGGVDIDDLPDPVAARDAIAATPFMVSLELRTSAITESADVVFPVAPVTEKAGTFVNWEGRRRGFEQAVAASSSSDLRVLSAIAQAMGRALALDDAADARRQLERLGSWDGPAQAVSHRDRPPRLPGAGHALLAGWRMLLDKGRLQDGARHLADTGRAPVVRLSPATAVEISATAGDPVTVSTVRGSVTLPLVVTEMPDRVVWLPMNSPGSAVHRDLGVTLGAPVAIRAGDTR